MGMPAPTPILPDSSRRDWTVDELEALPEDGNRYEIIDGELLVTPAPSRVHQNAVRELLRLLLPYEEANGLELYFAPTAVRWGPRSEVKPDVFVLPRRSPPEGRVIEGLASLVLAVEVVSPSTVRADRYTKRAAYLAEGVAEYWIIDCSSRMVERWRPGDSAPDVLMDSLLWQPRTDSEPLPIDLPSYFRKVHGED